MIYETILVGGEHDATSMRYATEAQAWEGSPRVVEELRAGRSPIGASSLTQPASAHVIRPLPDGNRFEQHAGAAQRGGARKDKR